MKAKNRKDGLNNFLNSKEGKIQEKINYGDLVNLSKEMNLQVENGTSPEVVRMDFELKNPFFRVIRFNDFFGNFSHFSILPPVNN